jgi:hypothetical protein
MTKPYAEIRSALVEGIRNNPDKSDKLKAAAEVWIGVIDHIEKHGANPETDLAFKMAHKRFTAAAEGQPFPEILSPAEIAKAFGLGKGGEA